MLRLRHVGRLGEAAHHNQHELCHECVASDDSQADATVQSAKDSQHYVLERSRVDKLAAHAAKHNSLTVRQTLNRVLTCRNGSATAVFSDRWCMPITGRAEVRTCVSDREWPESATGFIVEKICGGGDVQGIDDQMKAPNLKIH